MSRLDRDPSRARRPDVELNDDGVTSVCPRCFFESRPIPPGENKTGIPVGEETYELSSEVTRGAGDNDRLLRQIHVISLIGLSSKRFVWSDARPLIQTATPFRIQCETKGDK